MAQHAVGLRGLAPRATPEQLLCPGCTTARKCGRGVKARGACVPRVHARTEQQYRKFPPGEAGRAHGSCAARGRPGQTETAASLRVWPSARAMRCPRRRSSHQQHPLLLLSVVVGGVVCIRDLSSRCTQQPKLASNHPPADTASTCCLASSMSSIACSIVARINDDVGVSSSPERSRVDRCCGLLPAMAKLPAKPPRGAACPNGLLRLRRTPPAGPN